MKYCPYCQAVLEDSDAFCGSCGSPQPAVQQFEQPFEQPFEQTFEQPAEQPYEQSFSQPSDQFPTQPIDQFAGQQFEQPINQVTEPPFEQPINQVAEPQFEQPVSQPFEQYTQPIEQPAMQQFDQQYNPAFDQPWAQQAPVTAPVYQNDPGYNRTVGGNSSNLALDALKKLCGSPLVIIIALLITTNIVLQLFSGFVSLIDGQETAITAMENALEGIGNDASAREFKNQFLYNYSNYLSNYSGAIFGWRCFNLIAPIITAIGFWVVLSAGMQKQSGLKTGGFTTLKASNILQLIFACIGAAFSFLGVAIIHFAFSSSKNAIDSLNSQSDELPDIVAQLARLGTTMFIITYFILALVFTLVIVYRARIIVSLNRAKRIANNTDQPKKASAFAAVIMFIIGAFSALQIVSAGNNIIDMFINITQAGYMICVGVLIFMYNSKISAIQRNAELYGY